MKNFLKKYKQEIVLAILICIYISYFTIASFLRYDNFYTGRYDLGNMDQAVWNTINGRIFQTSNDVGAISSRLSGHADFILVLLSPLYLIWSHPKMLLLVQSVSLALGSVFIFLIAKNVIKSKNLALIFGFLFLMNPLMQFANLYDFHAVTIATTTLLASFYFLLKRRYLLLTIFLLLSGLAKEQIWIIVSIFGFFMLFHTKEKRALSLGIILSSLAIFGFLIWFAIPMSKGSQHFALSYYSDFGNSPAEIIKNVLLSPQKIFSIVFDKGRIDYLKQLLAPLGYTSLLSPLYLVFAIPDLLIKLLSNNPHLYQRYYQYSAPITPFIFISSIFSIKKIMKWFPKIPKYFIAIFLLFSTFYSAYNLGPLPWTKHPNTAMFTKPQKNKAIIEDFLLKIPEKYSVAATNNLGSHLSQREIIYTIPVGVNKADVVLFLLDNKFVQASLSAQREMTFDLNRNPNYAETFRKDNFVVFKKIEILL